MTQDEYKQARKELGFSVDGWIARLGITIDTHKSFSSGRREVNAMVANHIDTLLELKKIKKTS